MKLVKTPLPGVLIVEPAVYGDERGWFMETFNEPRWRRALDELGEPQPRPFVQDNHSCSHAGVLRGLHYQLPPHAQGKLVRVVKGRAFDVAVDIRRGSANFGQWFGVELDAVNRRQIWIPEGFAHGFLALEDDTQVLYKTTDVYAAPCEGGIRWDDPDLAIRWPSLPNGAPPRLSERDARAAALKDAVGSGV